MGEYGSAALGTAPGACLPCPAGCAACTNRTACTACNGALALEAGACSNPASRKVVSRNEGYEQLLGTAASIKASAGTGELDLGYTIGSLGMTTPTRAPATNASNVSVAEQYEVQQILLVADKALNGSFTLSFNGAVTAPLDAQALHQP